MTKPGGIPWSLGIDLSQASLGLVAVPGVFFDTLAWPEVRSIALGRVLGKEATAWDRGCLLRDQVDGTIEWVYSHGWGPPQSVWAEAYPMGSGHLYAIDRVAEVGGALRVAILREWGLPMHGAAIRSSRELLLGSLTLATLESIIAMGIEGGVFRSRNQASAMGVQKAAVWAELCRMGARLFGPDAGDAFVALNYGRYASGLPCLANILDMIEAKE